MPPASSASIASCAWTAPLRPHQAPHCREQAALHSSASTRLAIAPPQVPQSLTRVLVGSASRPGGLRMESPARGIEIRRLRLEPTAVANDVDRDGRVHGVLTACREYARYRGRRRMRHPLVVASVSQVFSCCLFSAGSPSERIRVAAHGAIALVVVVAGGGRAQRSTPVYMSGLV